MVNIGIIGCGYWGPNLIRNLIKVKDCQVVAVADQNPERIEQVKYLNPGMKVTTVPEELVGSDSIDGIVIATPISTHFDLARACLRFRRARGDLLLRLRAAQPRAVPAGFERTMGSRTSRFLTPDLPAEQEAGSRVGLGKFSGQMERMEAGEHRVCRRRTRKCRAGALSSELAFTGQAAADADRRKSEDGHLRSS